ncbi:MAG: tyrosine-type recombinase/integrase [Chloroflexi bacterium]|jgi:integrase/recombinase XerC|nr:tyrosine-type recombinase/integrase [Chloroflexota bacterium]
MNNIIQVALAYLDSVKLSRSENTARTYTNALNVFMQILEEKKLPPAETPIEKLSEEAIVWLATALKDTAPATERLYLTATTGFYEYLAAEKLSDINLPRLRLLIKQRARRPGQRLPQFPRENIEKVILYAINMVNLPFEGEREQLRHLRDRAFLLTLADTGLRVHEACGMRRGDVDWSEARAIIIGKGDKEAVVRFSSRAVAALKVYLNTRVQLDGASGRPLTSLPLFARHDKRAGSKVLPMTTTTGRNIVKQRVQEALGEQAAGTITPHSFRHYFVTTVLRGSGGNLKLAQELARHSNVQTTSRYAHLANDELDRGYFEIFE